MITNLDKEEQEILDSFEKGEWETVPDFETRRIQIRESAKATLQINKKISIQISERDFRELQRQAVHEGLPYKTFISSVLHKFVNGRLVERCSISSR